MFRERERDRDRERDGPDPSTELTYTLFIDRVTEQGLLQDLDLETRFIFKSVEFTSMN